MSGRVDRRAIRIIGHVCRRRVVRVVLNLRGVCLLDVCLRRRLRRARLRRWEERDSGYQLAHMLHNVARAHAPGPGDGVGAVHDEMYLCLLHDVVLGINWRCVGSDADTATIPRASNFIARDDLCQAPGCDMSDFDEARVEQEDIRRMEGDALCCSFPFNSP